MKIEGHDPGGFRDRCSRCGGWISMGHAEGSACQLIEKQEPLGKEFQKVLSDNLWDLYGRS